MAKAWIPKPITTGRQQGLIRKLIGKKKYINGQVNGYYFYLGRDPAVAQLKAERIEMEWKTCRINGHQWWPEDALQKLQDEGIIDRSKTVNKTTAARMLRDPLSSKELLPYCDRHGIVKPEYAPQVLDDLCRKVFARGDIRDRFSQDLFAMAMKDPLSTFERLSKLFGWTGQEARAAVNQMFNINGTMASPILFDESAGGI